MASSLSVQNTVKTVNSRMSEEEDSA